MMQDIDIFGVKDSFSFSLNKSFDYVIEAVDLFCVTKILRPWDNFQSYG